MAQRAAALLAAALFFLAAAAAAQGSRSDVAEGRAEGQSERRESPWLALPTFTVDPKLGASLGAMVGYMHYFDEKSRPSMFGVTGTYTSTDSAIVAAFAQASFDEDRQRVVAMAAGGRIRNDYDDYLGSGVPLKSVAELSAALGRYLYRVHGDWFAGVQGMYTNFYMFGDTAFDQAIVNVLGLQGFNAGGVGLAAYYDSRDNERIPTRGFLLNANNMAFRERLAGSSDFDVYRVDARGFFEHGRQNVLAARLNNQWTVDAPPAALASVQLRGYKQGQYLGKSMASVEVEERLRLAEKWTATGYLGVACLYGAGKSCGESDNVFPAAGLGAQYILRAKEGIVLNLEYATGKAGNYGVYLKLGYGF